MALNATFTANFQEFFDAVEKSKTVLRGFQNDAEGMSKALGRIGDSFSGQRIIEEATLTAKAIKDLGGYVNPTTENQKRATDIFEKAARQMEATGDTGSAVFRTLADGTRAFTAATQ